MIELIAIYLTSKNIAEIAKDKGYSKGLWRLIAILAWIIFEFIGAVFGLIMFGEDGFMFYIPALIGAFLGVFIVRKILDSKPNVLDNSNSLLDN